MSSWFPLSSYLKTSHVCGAGEAQAPWHARPHQSCALEGLACARWSGRRHLSVLRGWQKPRLPGAPLWCCDLAVIMISQLFIVITLITLNSLGINEDVMCTWTGIFIVVQR